MAYLGATTHSQTDFKKHLNIDRYYKLEFIILKATVLL